MSRSGLAGLLRAALITLAAGAASLALFSCGGEPPEIMALEWRLETRPLKDGRYESLSAFAAIRDPDGIDDIEAIWIIHEGSELYWTLGPDSWLRRSEGSETWIGGADLALPDRGALPRGPYRIVVADLGGRRIERGFRLEEPGKLPPPPRLERGTGGFTVQTAWPETLVLAYDAAGELIKAVQKKPLPASLESLIGVQEAKRARSLAVYGYDPEKRSGAYSWRTILN